MVVKLRFTGAWPPRRYWHEYPNWEYALEEEGVDGQDETTLRPGEIQGHIADYTAFTVGQAELADGRKLPALLDVFSGKPGAINVFVDEENAWRIYDSGSKWVAYVESWLPEKDRSPCVAMHDTSVFPLKVRSRLARGPGGTPYNLMVHSDGSAEELK